MPTRKNRYAQMRQNMTYILIADFILFIIYLFAAGYAVIWLKALSSIIAIIASGLCLGYLYLSQELLRKRSLWMTVAAGAILFCILFSLILNFPCPPPSPYTIAI